MAAARLSEACSALFQAAWNTAERMGLFRYLWQQGTRVPGRAYSGRGGLLGARVAVAFDMGPCSWLRHPAIRRVDAVLKALSWVGARLAVMAVHERP